MRKSRVAGLLVARSGIVGYAERHGWRSMIFREHDAQTVLQRVLLYGNLYFLGCSGGIGPCGPASRCSYNGDGCDSQRQGKSASRENSETLHVVLRANVF